MPQLPHLTLLLGLDCGQQQRACSSLQHLPLLQAMAPHMLSCSLGVLWVLARQASCPLWSERRQIWMTARSSLPWLQAQGQGWAWGQVGQRLGSCSSTTRVLHCSLQQLQGAMAAQVQVERQPLEPVLQQPLADQPISLPQAQTPPLLEE